MLSIPHGLELRLLMFVLGAQCLGKGDLDQLRHILQVNIAVFAEVDPSAAGFGIERRIARFSAAIRR